jgi:hypothetical protein
MRQAKALGAGTGGAFGSAIGLLAVYFIEQGWHDMPAEVDASLVVVITTFVAYAAAYLSPANTE